MIMPVSIKNKDNILQFYNTPSALSIPPPKTLLTNAIGKEQVFEEGKSKTEPQTAPVCLTLFNEAPAVRHRRLNPPHFNICQLKDFNASVGKSHQAKAD